MAHVHEKIDP